MFTWRQILQSDPVKVPIESTIEEVLNQITKTHAELVLIVKDGRVVGYVDQQSLLQQIQISFNLQRPIEYSQDILQVPLEHEIEFYHNISVYIGVNEHDEIEGYCTDQRARQRMHELRLAHINQLSAGAGIGMITTNSFLEITFVNEMAEKILGLSSAFLLNRNYSTLIEMKPSLEDVLAGKSLISESSYLNFKDMIGNFSPLIVNGECTGLIHIFFLREHWEEAAKELEFVRDLSEDLQAIYSSSHEQIMVVNPQGTIMRLTGTFLKDYWDLDHPNEVTGLNVFDLEKKGFFHPNIVEMCIKKGSKLSCIQEGKNGKRLWSVATPVFYEGQISKIIIISRDITEVNKLREELMKVQQESKGYKQALEKMKNSSTKKSRLVYQSQVMGRVVEEIRMVADVDSTILIHGESGVGKEVIANAIHEWSTRHTKRFVQVNCGAIPEQLMESELFGYEKGAFTGADSKGKPGYFEMANQGSIFLDEISELPLNMQVKLLRIIQEREITRVGGTKTIPLNVRIIAATNRDLWDLVQEGKFREDLYYRLHVIPIYIPPLRERKEDIMPLSLHFLQHYNQMYQKDKHFFSEALDVLESHTWQGNVRELQNVTERLVVTSRENGIHRDDVLSIIYANQRQITEPVVTLGLMPLKQAIEEVEMRLITLGLKKYGTAAKVSEVLRVSPATISRRIKKLLK
ncbi:Fis family transcriptional regulator [Bacillus sp. MUM 116]|uniref:sigma 54-interacting transcriptional regulator n=1 Tax=Bacillus sp. MUM 116 TaxID=1678002 RepID=UPI0008F581DD|nr:sigma 54-interacting transcriptional regulator [Bacillus sp. MUM 116]OIK13482.1 Fis family transcriptional regulator [Bacillus sp. MUM 116]